MKRFVPALLTAIFAAALSGCGGGSGDALNSPSSENPFALQAAIGTDENALFTTPEELINNHPDLTEFSQIYNASRQLGNFAWSASSYTLVAPSNAAFEQYSDAQKISINDDRSSSDTFFNAHYFKDELLLSSITEQFEDPFNDFRNFSFIEREGNLFLKRAEIEFPVIETHVFGHAVIYIIDEIFNKRTLFRTDPGTLPSELYSATQSTFGLNEAIENTKWRGILGNNEKQWILFLPDDGAVNGVFDFVYSPNEYRTSALRDDISIDRPAELVIADHLIEILPDTVLPLQEGSYQSASGTTLNISYVGEQLTVNGHDIDTNRITSASNGTIYLTRTALSVDSESNSNLELNTIYESLTALSNRAPNPLDPTLNASKFFKQLIEITEQTDLYNNPASRLTLLIPSLNGIANNFNGTQYAPSNTVGACRYPLASIQYWIESLDGSVNLIPDVFPDKESALEYLYDHTLVGASGVPEKNQIFSQEQQTLSQRTVDSTHQVTSFEYLDDFNARGHNLKFFNSEHISSLSNGVIYQVPFELYPAKTTELTIPCGTNGEVLGERFSLIYEAGLTRFVEAMGRIDSIDLLEIVPLHLLLIPTNSAINARYGQHISKEDATELYWNHTQFNQSVNPDLFGNLYGDYYPIVFSTSGITSVGGLEVTPLGDEFPELYRLEGLFD